MNENGRAAIGTMENCDWPRDTGPISCLNRRQALRSPSPEHEPGPIPEPANRTDDLVRRIASVRVTQDGSPVSRRREGLALKPYPPIEGHRQILDDDQDPAHHVHKTVQRAAVIRHLSSSPPGGAMKTSRPRVSRTGHRGSYELRDGNVAAPQNSKSRTWGVVNEGPRCG